MVEQEEAVLSSANPPAASNFCEECKTNPSKYKCPGCSIRSCSLPCVKAHKQRTACTGKRKQTQFVPLSQFDDNLLLSDYNMLEEVKRIADSAERTRLQLCGNFRYGLPFHLKNLQRAAGQRKTKILFLSSGMSKREVNKTYYNYKKKFISWTIEWRFHSTDVKLMDHGIHEKSNLYSVIENHLKPGPSNHPLKQFCLESVESLKFFISKNPKGSKSPFRELDVKAPIREQLSNLLIIEYPVIHVFLPSHSINFEVVKDSIPQEVQPKSSVSHYQSSPKGVFFREEEIKDDSSTEPHVLDLMKQSEIPFDNSKPSCMQQSSETGTKDEAFTRKSSDDCFHPNNQNKELGNVDLMDFDFDPELIDVYSNLISETNPDDFLDLEGLLGEDVKLEEVKGQVGKIAGGFDEELEEGEIVDSD